MSSRANVAAVTLLSAFRCRSVTFVCCLLVVLAGFDSPLIMAASIANQTPISDDLAPRQNESGSDEMLDATAGTPFSKPSRRDLRTRTLTRHCPPAPSFPRRFQPNV